MRQFRRILLGVLAGIALTAYVILSFPIRLSDSRPALWADIPVETAEEFWEWLADENKRLRGVTRRASWGALSGQGAKASMRTNLRDDRRYLMSRNSGGFTNQFMSMANAVYLAHYSNRIPILLPFTAFPEQLGGPDLDISVSDVFDLSRLSLSLEGMPIVEMHELRQFDRERERHAVARYDGEHEVVDTFGKTLAPGDSILPERAEREPLPCWSWDLSRGQHVENLWYFDNVHWMPLPRSVFAEGQASVEHSDLRLLSEFARDASGAPQESLHLLDELNRTHPSVLPDPQLFCLDVVFWYAEQPRRWDFHTEWREGLGVWAAVGRHARFQPGLVRIADDYLRHAFGVSRQQAVPPFFAMHIRRGDFPPEWLESMSADHYAHAAWETLQEIRRTLGIHIDHIVFTTDERDPEWIAPLLSYGWHHINHDLVGTGDRFGYWLPTLLDSIILSRATGFLGTHGSTMSIMAMRRVIDWNGGVARFINWGHSISDNWAWEW